MALSSSNETFYNSKSALTSPKQFLKQTVLDLSFSRNIAWQLFRKNFFSQYRQNFLGYLWVLLPPLATALIWIFLHFSKIIDLGTTEIPYPLYVLTGIFLWQTFTESVTCPLQQLLFSRHLITKFKIPHEALVIAGLGSIVFSLLVRLVILLVCSIYFQVGISWNLLLAPIGLAVLILLGMAIGLLLTPLGMLYKDILSGIGIVLNVLFFLTPIIYPLPKNGAVSTVVSLNPLTSVINTNRNWLTGGNVMPDFSFYLVISISIFLFFGSWLFYRLAKPFIIERIST
ncbi:MAG TPA: ABC transporter permease [Pyrinomonadaceae bacterium]|nr:ABC transporter permease [Pyrinomonadaceae bacterium]